MVLGGEGRGGNNGNGLDSTEIFSYRDNVWNTIAEKLPDRIRGVRATTINNRILIFGNYDLHMMYFCIAILIIIQVEDHGKVLSFLK